MIYGPDDKPIPSMYDNRVFRRRSDARAILEAICRRARRYLHGFLLLTSIAFALHAETTVKEYKAAMTDPISASAMWVYVTGLGEGMVWANTEATSKGAPLFCQPDDIALGPEDYVNILDAQIKAASKRMPADEVDKAFLGLVLMSGLKARFPCSGEAK